MAGVTLPRRVTVLLAGLTLLLGAVASAVDPPRATASSAAPPAGVHISARAYEGPRGTINSDLRARCAPGFEFSELVLDWRQGDVTTPSLQGRPFPCDGRWHWQRVSSLEAFDAGPATLTARLTVVDSATGDPAPQAVQTKTIYVRPAAKIVLPRVAHLRADGSVRLTVWARCDAPWVLAEYHVGLVQGEFPTIGSAGAYLDLACDGALHPATVSLRSEGAPFHRGAIRAEGSISLLDPEQFDPVTQVTTTRKVWLR